MSEWKETTLGELVTFQRGHDLPKTEFNDGEYPILGSNGIIGYHNEYTTEGAGITIGRSGNIGNPFYTESNFWAHNTTLYVKEFHNSFPKFVFYFLKTIDFQSFNSGSAVPSLNRNYIHPFPVFVPEDIEEQKQIADVLSCLDAKIENLRRQNETLEQIAQTLFKHWFIDFEFPNADGKPYKSSGGAMVASELGDIPEGLKFSKIGDEVETVGGGTPSTTEPSYWENGDILWYSPTDLTKAKTLFSIDSEKKITKLGLQKSKEACTNQGFITIIPNTKFSVYFLYGWLLTKIGVIKQLASGSTFPEISKTNFRSLDFLIPASNILEKYEQLIKPTYKKI